MKTSKADRPIWSEGMTVCPQHMQQQDIYHEQVVDQRLRSLFAQPWGLLAIVVNPSDIESGTVSLSRFEGIMPDGTIVIIDATSASSPKPRAIAPAFPTNHESLSVFIGIPLRQDSAPNFTKATDPVQRRYRRATRVIHDEITGKDRPLEVSHPNLVLLLGDERQDEYSTIQVAELIRTSDGHYALSPSYIPPVLSISASAVLLDALRELVGQALVKRRRLASDRATLGTIQHGLRLSDLDKALFIQGLDTHIPLLRSYLSASTVNPSQIYQTLMGLCGSLTLPSGKGSPTDLPPLYPCDLRATFEPLISQVREQLETEFSSHFVDFDLTRTSTHWVARDPRIGHCRELYLAIVSESKPSDSQALIVTGTKAASLTRLRLILRSASPGIPISALGVLPHGIPARPGETFFSLDRTSPLFTEAQSQGEIAVYMQQPFDPSTTHLRILGMLQDEAEE